MLTAVSLCSGYLGLDLAVEHVLGAELIAWSEIDPDACRVIAHHRPDAEPLGDLTTRTTWPSADVLTAGFPCQPVSTAGARKGNEDDRWLWDDVLRAIRLVGPRVVALENVAGLASLGGPRVVGDLAACGYRVRWSTLRASDVGACHQRRRIFIVATHPDDDDLRSRVGDRRDQAEWSQEVGVTGDSDRAPADDLTLLPTPTARLGTSGTTADPDLLAARADRGPGVALDDAIALLPTPNASLQNYDEDPEQFLARREQVRQKGINGNGIGMPLGVAVKVDWGQYVAAIARHEHLLGRPAPDPLDGRNLAARFVEWMMCLPEGWVTDSIDNRRAALRMLGNGVVPAQAATAVARLLADEMAAA